MKNEKRDGDDPPTAHAARKIVADKMDELGLPYRKLTSRVVSFAGFGWGRARFVKVHGSVNDPRNAEVSKAAKDAGFCVEFDCGL